MHRSGRPQSWGHPQRGKAVAANIAKPPPNASPEFPVREAPLASVERGFLLPPTRTKTA
jgi:hypothetical protein